MIEVGWTIDAEQFEMQLETLQKIATGQAEGMRAVMRRVGLAAMADIQQEVRTLSRGGQVRDRHWRKVSPMTALFRRRGSAGKITNSADLRQRAAGMPILQDTGRLLASFSPNVPGNVFFATPLKVSVGTNDTRAGVLHQGGSTRFVFDDAKQARFARNVRKVLPGPKPKLTPTGKKSRAKKHWNPFYFQMWNAMRKASGRVFRVPARPLIAAQPSSEQMDVYGKIMAAGVDELLRGGK